MTRAANPEYLARARANKVAPQLLGKIIDKIPVDGKFLDVGCGVGVFLRQLIDFAKDSGRNDISFYAFDYNQQMVEESQKLNPEAEIFQDNLTNLTSEIARNSFDYVNATNVLFFFNPESGDRDRAFENLKSITKKDGILKVSLREARFDKKPASHFFDFTENDLRTTMQRYGFAIESSAIGKKTNYGSITPDNLDRFYNTLTIVGKNIEQIPSPTLADEHSRTRAQRLESQQKGRGGNIK